MQHHLSAAQRPERPRARYAAARPWPLAALAPPLLNSTPALRAPRRRAFVRIGSPETTAQRFRPAARGIWEWRSEMPRWICRGAAAIVAGCLAGAVVLAQGNLEDTRRRAEQGDAAAQFWLGASYAAGVDVDKDEAKAAHWFQLAAMQGEDRAQNRLGNMYAEGARCRAGLLQSGALVPAGRRAGERRSAVPTRRHV